VNNCHLSGNGHQQQQQQQHQYQQQKPLSISANNFSPASNTTSSFSDNSKTLYKSSSHNTGGTCDKNYQQQATQQQQLYGGSSKNDNSASYFDFEHMLNEPNIDSQNHNLNKSHNTTASGSSRSSRLSYQANQAVDQFQGSFNERFLSEKFLSVEF
jgi:hypothetical protein